MNNVSKYCRHVFLTTERIDFWSDLLVSRLARLYKIDQPFILIWTHLGVDNEFFKWLENVTSEELESDFNEHEVIELVLDTDKDE